jgi:hypothetical protein
MHGPDAFLLTFRTYASQLPGDERGWCHHSQGMQPPHSGLHAHSMSLLRGPIITLDELARDAVLRAIQGVCGHRGWALRAAHVRTQHVHALVGNLVDPDRAIRDFKIWSTRGLRETAHPCAEGPVWARGGSKVPLWDSREVEDAARYVYERQGEPMARFGM